MNTIDQARELSPEITNEIEQVRNAAAAAEGGLRTLRDMEMGWVAGGGDAIPLW